MTHSRLTRIYFFLANKWHIPLDPGHYLDLLVLLVLAGTFGLLAIWQGGMNAASLPWAARLTAVAIGFHLITLATRAKYGFRLSRLPLLFVPWLVWCLLDWFFFSPKPWLAEISLITSCMVFTVFSLSLHHFRHPWLKWIIGGLLTAFLSMIASIALGDEQHLVGWLLEHTIDPIYTPLFSATLAHPAGMGAVLLLAFFPCFSIVLGYRWRHWQRLLAAYFSVILLIGIFSTLHIGVMVGFFVGVVVLCILVVRNPIARITLIAAALFGLGWTAKDVHRQVGFLRQNIVTETTPTTAALPGAAWDAFKDAPVQGVGTGGFSLSFEQSRPVGWKTSPRTPGSLPLALLAEHGIVGTLLLLAPIVWIWLAGLSACLAYPLYETSEKSFTTVLGSRREGRKRIIKLIRHKPHSMPEERIFLGSVLSGTMAAGVLLIFDYPGPMPAVACFFAIQGGALLRHVKQSYVEIRPQKALAPWLRGLAFLKPALWLLWVLAPLIAAHLVETSAALLNPHLHSTTGQNNTLADPVTESSLQDAEGLLRKSIQLNPANGDAWNLQALLTLRRYASEPNNGPRFGAIALYASEQALKHAPDDFSFHLTRGSALLMTGQQASAIQEFREAHRLAPYEATALLTLADALGRLPATLPEARALLGTAAQFYPENAYIRQRLSLLQLGTLETLPPPP